MDQQTDLKNQNMNHQPETSLNHEQSKDKMSEEQELIQKSKEKITACVIPGDKKCRSEQDQKPKRTRKTIEQELAELDVKRQRLIEKKRSQDAHEKIVFGSTVIAMLKEMKGRNDINDSVICKAILSFTEVKQPKNLEVIKKIIDNINDNN